MFGLGPVRMDLATQARDLSPEPMTTARQSSPSIRAGLATLAAVRVRQMFGTEAYFAGTVMFAFLAEEGLVLRLTGEARESALASRRARPYLGALPEGLSGWVVVPVDADVPPLMSAAHSAARGMSRSVARRRALRRGRKGRKVTGSAVE